MKVISKSKLFEQGCELLTAFCNLNRIEIPKVVVVEPEEWMYRVCAYYRSGIIYINVKRCAQIGLGGRAWSYPGYVIDRTPYGVLQHELGHHVDVLYGKNKGKYYSEFSANLRRESLEAPLTGYCPNDAEWFAEMFRLFVTNPNLLHKLKPKTYHGLASKGFKPYFKDDWLARLRGAPSRIAWQAEKKVEVIRAKGGSTPLF